MKVRDALIILKLQCDLQYCLVMHICFEQLYEWKMEKDIVFSMPLLGYTIITCSSLML